MCRGTVRKLFAVRSTKERRQTAFRMPGVGVPTGLPFLLFSATSSCQAVKSEKIKVGRMAQHLLVLPFCSDGRLPTNINTRNPLHNTERVALNYRVNVRNAVLAGVPNVRNGWLNRSERLIANVRKDAVVHERSERHQ
jgi:hypothetical protein